ncbi:hypothetical protein IVA98_12925 [Bradyrhizobium sp. 160]|nr:hypothetical protein [Bradyrhizobium sp. 160]MCK1624084.1 hypothetical protein [Bradyrhizobium sp. 160]
MALHGALAEGAALEKLPVIALIAACQTMHRLLTTHDVETVEQAASR